MKNKLLKLKLIKTKLYRNKRIFEIDDIIPRIKKSLLLIYKYHILRKKILFIGTPTNFDIKYKIFYKITNHIFIPEDYWIYGILTNKYTKKSKKISKTKISQLLFTLKKKFDLIVVLKTNSTNQILEEVYKTQIPVILFNYDFELKDFKADYKVPLNFKCNKKKINNNIIYSLLFSMFKKSNRITKKKFIYTNQLRQKFDFIKSKNKTNFIKSKNKTKKKVKKFKKYEKRTI